MAQYDFITNETPTLNQIREFGWIQCIRDLYRKHNSLTKNVDVLTTMEEGQSTDGQLSPESIALITDYGQKLKNLGTYTHIYHSGNTSGHTQTWYADADNVYLQYFCTAPKSGTTTEHNHTTNKAPLPVASATQAGIITADDYKKLNNIVSDTNDLQRYFASNVLNLTRKQLEGNTYDLVLVLPFMVEDLTSQDIMNAIQALEGQYDVHAVINSVTNADVYLLECNNLKFVRSNFNFTIQSIELQSGTEMHFICTYSGGGSN